MYQNWDFWFENMPSGNPGLKFGYGRQSFQILEKIGFVKIRSTANTEALSLIAKGLPTYIHT
jgi:hypothetical protein